MKKAGVIRPGFVDGMLLTAEDFRLEQCYLNRRLVQFGQRPGWGVVEGMDVVDYSHGKKCPTLKVTPGYALDAQGREIVLGEDQEREIAFEQDRHHEISAGARFLCARYCDPDRLPAGIAGKMNPPKDEAQVVRTVERAQLGFLAAEELRQGIECGWVPLARIDLRGDQIIAIVTSRGLTRIVATSWQHGKTGLPAQWSITFSAPVAKPPAQAIEIRVRDRTGADVYPEVTDLKLDAVGTKLSFKLARMAEGMVHIRIACDFIMDWKGQPVSGAHLGGCLPSGNGIAGGVFESWFMVRGKHP